MPQNLTYVMPGVLVAGRALLGQYRLPQSVQITQVQVQAKTLTPGSGIGLTRLVLEVDGVGTTLTVELVRSGGDLAAGGLAVNTVTTNLIVPGGVELRWRCVEAPEQTEDGLDNWSLSMTCNDPGAEIRPQAVMTVRWRNGEEDTLLYNYDAGSGLFLESVPGIASGRATVNGGANFGVTFEVSSAVVMQARNDDLQVGSLLDNGGTATGESARLEFWITSPAGAERVGTLTEKGKLRVVQAVELGTAVDLPVSADRFVFRYGGQARAVLGMAAVGLVAVKVVESGGVERVDEEGDRRVTEEGDVRVGEVES